MKRFEIIHHLVEDILPFWNGLKDEENGGFFGYVDEYGKKNPKGDKGIILNNRILWFYSNAYLLLKEPMLKEMADHAYQFTVNHCIDKNYGGVYWSLDYKGNPLDMEKHTYNQAFAIYALSSYYKVTKDPSVLQQALDIFSLIEEKCRDKNGYLECFTFDFKRKDNEKLSENGVMAERTMNTLLHIIEAYTELYRVSKNEEVMRKLYNALELYQKLIFNEERKRSEVFFDIDYHSLIDLQSYGHDIEASWLLARACEVLGDQNLYQRFYPMITSLAESAYERGMREYSSMYYECENGVNLEKRTWWVQAETILGLYNAYQMTGEEKYKDASFATWNFVMANMVDKTGEWIEDFWDDLEKNKHQDLVQPWKCPYHNGRMCMEMILRLEENGQSFSEDTRKLYQKLKNISKEGRFLFGHQNDTFISVNPNTDSDVRMLTGDIPGLFGIDTLALAGNEMNPSSMEDSLKQSIEKSIAAHREGAIVTLSAHMPNFSTPKIHHKDGKILFNACDFMDCKMINDSYKEILPGGKYNLEFESYLDLIARYLSQLQEEHIAVIFRPFHEQNGEWFWWGNQIEREYYIRIFRYTKEYLFEKGITNILYAYSPNVMFRSLEEYLDRYPGDDIIDIMALDYYDDYLYGEEYREDFFTNLDASAAIVYRAALLHNKICAISEAGIRVSKTKENDDLNGLLKVGNPMKGHQWFRRVGEITLKYNMPYYLVWGNFCEENTYLPYVFPDGAFHEMAEDFIDFYHWDKAIFAHKG